MGEAELRFIHQGFVFGALGRFHNPTCFRLKRKKEKLHDVAHKYRRAKVPLETRLDVPPPRTTPLNRNMLDFKVGVPQRPRVREMNLLFSAARSERQKEEVQC